MTTTAKQLYLLSTLFGLAAINDVTAQAPILGCPDSAIPIVAYSTNNYNGDNAINASIMYICDNVALDLNDDILTTTCGNDGIWTTPESFLGSRVCPDSPTVCLGPTPIVINSIDDSLNLLARPPIGSKITYDCLANVSIIMIMSTYK